MKILLVEDEPMWQQGIRALVESVPGYTLCSVVDNADDGEIFFAAEHPDVVLVDWKIKGPRDGLEFAAWLAQHIDPKQIVLVTGSPPDQIPPHPYGYVPKSCLASNLLPYLATLYHPAP